MAILTKIQKLLSSCASRSALLMCLVLVPMQVPVQAEILLTPASVAGSSGFSLRYGYVYVAPGYSSAIPRVSIPASVAIIDARERRFLHGTDNFSAVYLGGVGGSYFSEPILDSSVVSTQSNAANNTRRVLNRARENRLLHGNFK